MTSRFRRSFQWSKLSRMAFAVCLVCGWIGTSRADQWPGWRGPARNGVATEGNAPTTWSATSGVRWKTPLPGSGISNPIVCENRVICTSSDGVQNQDLHAICLDRETGKQLWHVKLWGTAPTLYHETKSSMASPSPITDGRHVFAFFGTGDVFCLDLNGQLIWHRSLSGEYGVFENRFAASSSPLLFEDSVIVQCDHYGSSYVIAIDKKTGANRWKAERPGVWLSWSSPICIKADGSRPAELIVAGSEKLEALDPRTGEKLWTLRGMARECIPTPIEANGLIYAVSGPNGTSYAVRPGGRGDITESHIAWSNTRGNAYVPSAIVVGDYYYLADDHGIGICLDAHTGKQMWRKRFGGDFTASPVSAAGKIYFTNEAGETLVLRAGTKNYEELARNSIGQPMFASPAIAGGCFFLRSATQLWCLDGESGSQ